MAKLGCKDLYHSCWKTFLVSLSSLFSPLCWDWIMQRRIRLTYFNLLKWFLSQKEWCHIFFLKKYHHSSLGYICHLHTGQLKLTKCKISTARWSYISCSGIWTYNLPVQTFPTDICISPINHFIITGSHWLLGTLPPTSWTRYDGCATFTPELPGPHKICLCE